VDDGLPDPIAGVCFLGCNVIVIVPLLHAADGTRSPSDGWRSVCVYLWPLGQRGRVCASWAARLCTRRPSHCHRHLTMAGGERAFPRHTRVRGPPLNIWPLAQQGKAAGARVGACVPFLRSASDRPSVPDRAMDGLLVRVKWSENLDVALVCNVPTNFCVVLSGELS